MKMMLRRNRRLNMLRWCKPDLRMLTPITSDLGNYPNIKRLQITPKSLTMIRVSNKRAKEHTYGEFGISFSKMESMVHKGTRLIDMHVTMWLGNDKVDGKVTATGVWADVTHLDHVIQNWLYTYFVALIKTIDSVGNFSSFKFPEVISNWYPGSEWDYLPLVKSYSGSATEMISEVTQLKKVARKSPIPHILEVGNTI